MLGVLSAVIHGAQNKEDMFVVLGVRDTLGGLSRKMKLTHSITATLFLMAILFIPMISANTFGYNYLDNKDYVIEGANYSINVNNTEFHRGLTPQQVANLAPAPTLNSTQFETGEPVTIKISWLTSFIEGISKWTNYYLKTEVYNKTEIDSLIPTSYDAQFVRIYENDFWTVGDGYYAYVSGSGLTGQLNTDESTVFVRLPNTAIVGADSRIEFFGTKDGAGTTNNDVTTNPQQLIYFEWLGSKSISTLQGNFVIGCWATATEQNLQTLNRGLGFHFNNTDNTTDESQFLIPFSQTNTGRTNLAGFNVSGNQVLDLKITSNNPANAKDSTSTNFTFWKKQSGDSDWVNLGYIDTNIGTQTDGCSSWGVWLEKSVAGTNSLPTIFTDYAKVITSREGTNR